MRDTIWFKQLVVWAFALAAGSAAFLDDLLEGRPLRAADFLLATLLALFAAAALLTVTRIVEDRRRHRDDAARNGEEVVRLRGMNEDMCLATVDALAVALDVRDQYTAVHSSYVVELSGMVGSALGLDDDELADLQVAARLHDLGKLGVPDAILHKRGPLDPDEQQVMRMHPIWGEQMVRRVPGLERIADVVRAEHERWDGTGYPDGLEGEQIPLAARVVLACDAYHAMTSDRPYRDALTHAAALAELHANAGLQFDGRVVDALVGVFALDDERALAFGASPSGQRLAKGCGGDGGDRRRGAAREPPRLQLDQRASVAAGGPHRGVGSSARRRRPAGRGRTAARRTLRSLSRRGSRCCSQAGSRRHRARRLAGRCRRAVGRRDADDRVAVGDVDDAAGDPAAPQPTRRPRRRPRHAPAFAGR